MWIKKLIESVGLTSEEITPYLQSEIEEFLKSQNPKDQIEEFHDIIFALKNIAYAHTGIHIEIDDTIYENKIKNRLKDFGTISKKEPFFSHSGIYEMHVGLVHIAFGSFKQPWSNFDPLKYGTEAEIAMLTDIEFQKIKEYTNHLIITFDDVDKLEYSFLTSSWDTSEKNTVLCRIPDFIYKKAKADANFEDVENLLSFQVLAALKNLKLKKNCIFHFHSWESALAINSKDFRELTENKEKIFSPYLTVNRLKEFSKNNKSISTLNNKELENSCKYELKLINFCNKTVVESDADKDFYKAIVGDKIKKYSFVDFNKHVVITKNNIANNNLEFISGGRPVYEKGFFELVKEVPMIVDYSKANKLKFHLKIFCKEYDRSTHNLQRQTYIKALEYLITDLDINKYVSVLDKVSINTLRKEIRDSCGLIVPSIYDPYCLMPHYALLENRVSFVSKYTGISESIESKEYIFDPLKEGSLLNSINKWITEKKDFVLNNKNTSYKNLYLE